MTRRSSARTWSGSIVRRERARFAPMIAAGGVNCARCGLPVLPGMRWHVGHQLDRALGGGHEPSNLWPEHARCSTSAGGKLGQALRAGRVTAPQSVPVVTRRNWT